MSDHQENKLRILVVDDSKVILKAFSKILGGEYDITEARDGEEAWAKLQEEESICAVFTDMNMPNVNGLELLTRIRKAEDSIIKSLPVILVTSSEDEDDTVQQAFSLGITVLIRKPFDTLILKSCAKAHVKPRHLSTIEDEKAASIDPITKLANAAYFQDRGEKDRAFSIRQDTPMAVAILGIKNFSQLKESHSQFLKSILINVSNYIRSMIRQEDTLAHLGAGQFGILTLSINRENTIDLLGRIQANISSKAFEFKDTKITLNTAIGISVSNDNQDQPFKLLLNEAAINFAAANKINGDKLIANALSNKLDRNTDKQLTMLIAMLDRAHVLFQQHREDSSHQQIDNVLKTLTPLVKACGEALKLRPEEILKRINNNLEN